LINYKNDIQNSVNCYFKKSETDTTLMFLPEKIFGYRFSGSKYYVSKEIETYDGIKTIFVEFLVKGTINLYFYRDTFADHYLLQKAGLPIKEISLPDETIYIDNKPYKRDYLINRGLVRFYLNDCPELFDDIDKIKNPSSYQLINLLQKYYDIKCPQDVCIVYEKSLPKFRIDIQPVVGITKINNFSPEKEDVQFESSKQYGLITYLWLPFANERFFFRSGFLFSKKKVTNIKYTNAGDSSCYYSYNKYFKIPLQFQYVFLKKRISPTFGAGMNILICDEIPFSILSAVNIGLNVKVNQRFYISIDSEFDFYSNYFLPYITQKLVSASFDLGLTIKL